MSALLLKIHVAEHDVDEKWPSKATAVILQIHARVFSHPTAPKKCELSVRHFRENYDVVMNVCGLFRHG
jgi:hypothetical protein